MQIISREKIRNFVESPHIPFFLLSAINRMSPTAARFLKHGRFNVNTERYWNQRYEAADYDDERYRFLRHEVMGLVPPQTSVLDAGCGNGQLMELLRARKGCVCTGVDISGVAIKIVQNKGFNAIKCKLPNLPTSIPSDHFDGCTIIETLEHISRPEKTVRALCRVIKKGGFIIVGVPDDCMHPAEFDEHVSAFTRDTLHALLSRYFVVETTLHVASDQVKYLVIRGRKELQLQTIRAVE